MAEEEFYAGSAPAASACPNVRAGLILAGMILCLCATAGSQSKPSPPTLAEARKKYLGARVTIKGPLEAPPAGLLANYVNWRRAKKGAGGRYEPETDAAWGFIPYGYEKEPATVIAIQLSKRQTGAWVDILGNHHAADELGADFDFIVRFDDPRDGIAMCSSWLSTAEGDFYLIPPKPAAQK